MLEIKDYHAINEAKIEIGKINVVGGVNSSGKTTVSRLLYNYLKSHERIDSENIKFSLNSTFSDIFYLESISLLDLKDLEILNHDYVRHLKECLEIPKTDYTSEVLLKIKNIIGKDCFSSAGIKQFGIIQILLENQTLCENCFLIIDEPESNLHPDWQIRFAEILVLLVKELNITLYLNSYSPIFIEAISLYAQYYDLIKETNFYLTKKQPNGKFNFKKISPKNMGEVYENLTKPYDELDSLKAKVLFKE